MKQAHLIRVLSGKFTLALFSAVLLLTAEVARAVPLSIPGTDGKDHTPLVLAEGKKAVVLFFVSPYCPTSNTFAPEMNRIVEDHRAQFSFYMVHADADQKLTDILQHAEMMEIKAPVLLDKKQQLAALTGATTTPEAVILAPDGKTLYQGRINDLYLGPTKKQRQATTRDLRDALESLTAGQPVKVAKTEAMGCKITGMKP